ncbi:MAG TPA: TrkA family potassium uptake protein [bacterium]|nr:TrkA family potassium uptake protein [bacterium]
MRAVFVGAGSTTLMTVRQLLKRQHEVIIIERDEEVIRNLAEELGCGFLHGDGGKPAILREADPEHTDVLFCLTDQDQTNILASLVGRSLGFKRVVTKINDPELEHICDELGLTDTIVPSRTIGQRLADMLEGQDPLELSTMIREEARVLSFVVRKNDEAALRELKLPKRSRVVCLYRDGALILPEDEDLKLREDDEVIIIAHRDTVAELRRHWASQRLA